MKKILIWMFCVTAVLIAKPLETRSQERKRTCGTMEVHERLLKTVPSYREERDKIERFTVNYIERRMRGEPGLRSGIIYIPVVVHVVYNTAEQNISDAQIQSQIDILNQDYRKLNPDVGSVPAEFAPVVADVRIQFQLAVRDPNCHATNGITRTSTNTASFTDDDKVKSAATGGADPWPSDKYLNLWVCNLSGGLLGYAQFPGGPATTDGVVITYTGFGNIGTAAAPFNRGRTATHEIGHWFNLYHTFQGGCAGTSASDCGSAGDEVCDTPPTATANFDCPGTQNTCTETPVDQHDQTMNYMDYTDDACMFMFTAGQSLRMDAALAGPRASIVASDGLIPPPASATGVLWSRDTGDDTGIEPDPSSNAMYESDDIWVRNQNDGITNQEHQNPVYRPSGPPNYVYVQIRNLGCNAATSATHRLYWAKASSALSWPAPWDGSVATPALMGSQIGSQPSGVISGGGSTILVYPWNPPNPADYTSFGADKSHFCLLSRVETAPTSPYGMTFPETSDLYANVQNNNKIVWKNVEVDTTAREAKFGYLTVGNISRRPLLEKFTFGVARDKAGPLLFRWGTVSVDLGRSLFAKWKRGGSKGVGVQPAGGTVLNITQPQAWIGNLEFKPKELYTIRVGFTPRRDLVRGFNVFKFYVNQYAIVGEKEKRMGGQDFVIKTVSGSAERKYP